MCPCTRLWLRRRTERSQQETLVEHALCLVALAVRRANWIDDRVAPLLCVAVAAVAIFWANGAWASASLSPELRERYIFYPLPLVLALLPAVVTRVSPLLFAAVSAVFVLYLAPLFPGLFGSNGEEFVQYKIDQVTLRLHLGSGWRPSS